MTHHSLDLLSVARPLSHRSPPSGKALRARFIDLIDEETLIDELSRLSGRAPGAVAWLLRQDMIVPGGLLKAALLLDARLPRHQSCLRLASRTASYRQVDEAAAPAISPA